MLANNRHNLPTRSIQTPRWVQSVESWSIGVNKRQPAGGAEAAGKVHSTAVDETGRTIAPETVVAPKRHTRPSAVMSDPTTVTTDATERAPRDGRSWVSVGDCRYRNCTLEPARAPGRPAPTSSQNSSSPGEGLLGETHSTPTDPLRSTPALRCDPKLQ
eukprot:453881-Rhodomonas_salina.1